MWSFVPMSLPRPHLDLAPSWIYEAIYPSEVFWGVYWYLIKMFKTASCDPLCLCVPLDPICISLHESFHYHTPLLIYIYRENHGYSPKQFKSKNSLRIKYFLFNFFEIHTKIELIKRNGFQFAWCSKTCGCPKGLCSSVCGRKSKEALCDSHIILEPTFIYWVVESKQEFGFDHPMGGLTIPCREDVFLGVTSRLHRR